MAHRRPLPIVPRAYRRRKHSPASILLACPCSDPHWELSALHALIKPQLKGAILHRSSEQKWPRDGEAIARQLQREFEQRVGWSPDLHFPDAGQYFLAANVRPEDQDRARAFALALSKRMPGLWFVIDRLFVHDGRFLRRRFGYKLQIVVASNVHVPRELRRRLGELLS
jgi:hypothetical protein